MSYCDWEMTCFEVPMDGEDLCKLYNHTQMCRGKPVPETNKSGHSQDDKSQKSLKDYECLHTINQSNIFARTVLSKS